LSLLLAVAGCVAWGSVVSAICIGETFELSGRFAPYGAACKRGLDYAAANCGDTVAGKKCEFVYRDVQSDARATVSAFTVLSDARPHQLRHGSDRKPDRGGGDS
jgi:ABC-type branched-subunit amino acid transport system substrate-binding protein